MAHLSVIVITYNEEQNIEECLESVCWADEIIVVDAYSQDRTVELARKYTNRVYLREWAGYAPAKQFALEQATGDWVLWIDADERVTPELANQIREVVSRDENPFGGYYLPRRAYFLGRWIEHCGWYPGYVCRLFRRDRAHFDGALVHESVRVNGEIGCLQGDLIHYTDRDLEHYFHKFNEFTSLAAAQLFQDGRRFRLIDLLFRPLFTFFKTYIFKMGFLDGIQGFILSVLSSNYVFTKYAKLWERGSASHLS